MTAGFRLTERHIDFFYHAVGLSLNTKTHLGILPMFSIILLSNLFPSFMAFTTFFQTFRFPAVKALTVMLSHQTMCGRRNGNDWKLSHVQEAKITNGFTRPCSYPFTCDSESQEKVELEMLVLTLTRLRQASLIQLKLATVT